MRRREFIAAVGCAAASPILARAQPSAVPRIGFLHNATLEVTRGLLPIFSESLAAGGYVPGRDVAIEYRYAANNNDRLPALAAGLVQLGVAVIVTSNTPTVLAARAASQTIPIVFNVGIDPVELGLVSSLSRPGGNATGVSTPNIAIVAKRLELLHQILPSGMPVALLINPTNPEFATADTLEAERAAKLLDRRLFVVGASSAGELKSAFVSLHDQGAACLVVNGDSFFFAARSQIAALAAQYRVPLISPFREQVLAGGLMSYGTDLAKVYLVLGSYCVRILHGEKASELPVQQITKLALAINRRAARTLGLAIPELLFAAADEVIG
jgi:putative ABC transport system substrate-binding protein